MAEYVCIDEQPRGGRPCAIAEDIIAALIEKLPPFMAATEEARLSLHKSWEENISMELRKVRICPEKVEDFVNLFYDAFIKGRPIPGRSYGSDVAAAAASSKTQEALSSFHKSGDLSETSNAIGRLVSLLKAQSNQTGARVNIYFEDDISFEEAQQFQRLIEEIKGSTIISSTDIIPVEKARENWWYAFYDVPENSRYALRVRLSLEKMGRKRVTIQEFLDMIFRETKKTKVDSTDNEHVVREISDDVINDGAIELDRLRAVASPTFLSTVDFYYAGTRRHETIADDVEDEPDGGDEDAISEDYLLSVVLGPAFDTVINGIPGCDLAEAHTHTLSDLVNGEMPLWKSGVDRDLLRSHNLNPNDTFLPFNDLSKTIPFSEDRLAEVLHDVYHMVIPGRGIVIQGKKMLSQLKSKKRDMDMCHYVIARGNILSSVLAIPGVSHRFTTSGNMITSEEVFGIDNAVAVLTNRLSETVNGATLSTNPGFLSLIAKVFGNRGTILGSTSRGLNLRGAGALTLMAFERIKGYLTAAAASNSEEVVSNIAPCIYTGKRVAVGTGFSDVGMLIPMKDGTDKIVVNDETFNMHNPEVSRFLITSVIEEDVKDLLSVEEEPMAVLEEVELYEAGEEEEQDESESESGEFL